MKYSYYIKITLTLFISINAFGQLGTITGHIHDRRENKGMEYAMVFIVETKKGTMTDVNGNFKIDSILPGVYDIKYSELVSGDTTIKITVVSNSTTTLAGILPPYCKYDVHEKNKICPKCKKQDKVIPIVYGLSVGPLDKKNYYYAGCVITYCDPHWHCKRDKLEF